jgi:4-amino-4-deoxy-L-arabinose transferase
VAAFLAVAAPWYVACIARHGGAFVAEFFGRHHLERFLGDATLHPQPVWYYVPVMAAAVFPWTPLMFRLFARASWRRDPGARFLAVWLVFGFVFFSASRGKLPGYLLPLLPALTGLLALAIEGSRDLRWLLGGCVVLLSGVPFVAGLLPQALAVGLTRSSRPEWDWRATAVCLTVAACVWGLERWRKRGAAFGLTAVAAAAGILYLKASALPQVDRLVTARPVWKEAAARASAVCAGELPRGLRYSLNYYAGTPPPDCAVTPRPVRVEVVGGKPALVVSDHP